MTLLLAALFFISQPVANMHRHPDPTCEVVTQSSYAQPVTIVNEAQGWRQIETPDGYVGWVDARAVTERDEPYPQTTLVARTTTLCTHIYRSPDTTPSPPALSLPFGTKIELLSDGGDQRWHRCRLIDGQEQWIQRGDFTIDHTPLTLDEMLSLSREFIGIPYTWGGTTSFGFDCSGFVQLLYRQMGIDLPRDSQQQAMCDSSHPVGLDQIEPGDLLFFGKLGITHVALYLGDGRYIHSDVVFGSGRPTVRIDELGSASGHLHPLICARRIGSSRRSPRG